MQRVELHNHTWYSLLDGLDSPRESVRRAAELGMPAIAITDHGSLAGVRQFQRACKEFNVKPILGLEAYFTEDRFDKRSRAKRDDGTGIYEHLIILAKDQHGYENLSKLSELAWTEGMYHKPRMDFELLERYGKGIMVTSACMGGVLSKPFLAGNVDLAVERAKRFQSLFGEDFYIEVQSHNPAELNQWLLQTADELGIVPVAAGDCHYVHERDRSLEDAYLILSAHSTKRASGATYDTGAQHRDWLDKFDALYPDRTMSFKDINLYLQSYDEIAEDFAKSGITRTDIHENTLAVAGKVGEYAYYEHLDTLPQPKHGDPNELLRAKIAEGMKSRGLVGKKEYEDRIVEELEVIEAKEFSSYFLLVEDIISWAKSKGIRVGNGRGSACASLICYALGITNIDPIKYGLLFFRFISPDRKGYPDIDTDIEDRRRAEVKEYVMKNYDYVADIATYGYFRDKGVIRDAARVFLVPIGQVNAVLKKVDSFEAFEQSPETSDFRKKYPEVMELATKLRGKIRSTGKHAGGLIVSNQDISKYTSIETRKDTNLDVTVPVVAVDMTDAEDLGLVKQDLLGLKTLSVVEDTLSNIYTNTGKRIDIDSISFDDPKVYGTLSAGHTAGVFQVEQPAYTRLLKEMRPTSFEELTASNALVRPGAMNTIGAEYIARKEGRSQVKYIHPDVEHFTRDTFGLCTLYQEQVMLLMTDLAGMSMVQADAVRSAVAKKKDPKVLQKFKGDFIAGASAKIEPSDAEQLWSDIEAASDYSFNKAHSTAYSVLTYQTAWLKVHYPLEFMTALMANEKDGDSLTNYFLECKRLGVRVLLPHINDSQENFSMENGAVRIGLANIKSIGKSAKYIIARRPFSNYDEFVSWANDKAGVNKLTIDSLNAVGAAKFYDNPADESIRDNYYEYLHIPAFKSSRLPEYITSQFTDLEDYDEQGCHIVAGLVKKIKRGTGWARVEFVDGTGTGSAFHDEHTPLIVGQMYVMLIGGNTITRYCSIDEATDDKVSTFTRFLNRDRINIDEGLYVVLAFNSRKTKKGQLMATTVFTNKDKELRSALVFPGAFHKCYGIMKDGAVVKLALRRTQDDTLFVSDVRGKDG